MIPQLGEAMARKISMRSQMEFAISSTRPERLTIQKCPKLQGKAGWHAYLG
jgi:hypothetical protein